MTAKKTWGLAAMCILFVFLMGCTQAVEVGLPADGAAMGGALSTTPAWHMTMVPETILEKVAKQPDTMEYAANFYRFGERDLDMDISADVTEGEVPLFLQWDKRWGYKYYGSNYMGINGCAPTALAIVYAGLTGNTDVTPYDLAQYSVSKGLYVSGQGTKWDLMEEGGRYLGLKVQRIGKNERKIRQALADGKLLTTRVGAGDFTDGGHFIVICGIDENDILTIRDPNSREKTAQLWEFERVMKQSTCWWSFGL